MRFCSLYCSNCLRTFIEDAFHRNQTFLVLSNLMPKRLVVRMMISTNSERGDDGFQILFRLPLLYRFLYLGGSHSSVTLVGDCPRGCSNLCTNCHHDGNSGTTVC